MDAWKIFPLYCVLGSSHENLTGFLAQISKEVNFIIFEVLKSVHLVSRKHAIFCSSTIFIWYFQQKILPASCITLNKITKKNYNMYGSCTISNKLLTRNSFLHYFFNFTYCGIIHTSFKKTLTEMTTKIWIRITDSLEWQMKWYVNFFFYLFWSFCSDFFGDIWASIRANVDILFLQITTIIKVRVNFVFWLQTL